MAGGGEGKQDLSQQGEHRVSDLVGFVEGVLKTLCFFLYFNFCRKFREQR